MSPRDKPPEGHPAGLPRLFLDRSLGRLTVPRILRAAGLELVTLAEHYGMPADEHVEDVTWLAEAGRQGWVVLMKDARIRRRPAELKAVRAYRVRCFCITRADLSGEQMADRYLANLKAITHACRRPGPFIYAVQDRRIDLLSLGANRGR